MPLTSLKVRHAGPGRHADMHGLYLFVRNSGTRSWVLRMQHGGKGRDFGLGPAHDVPLSEARIQLHGELKSDCLPFSLKGDKPISDMTMLKVLRDMKVTNATVHGFRSTFADWAAESTNVPKEAVEKALAHQIPNAVEAAYRRTDFFDKRRDLMNAWARFLIVESPNERLPLGRLPTGRCRDQGRLAAVGDRHRGGGCRPTQGFRSH